MSMPSGGAGDIIDREQEGERSGRADQKADGRCLTGGLAESRENAARTQPVTEAEKQRIKRRKCCGLRGGDDADTDANHHDDAKTEGRYGGDGRAPALRSRGARQTANQQRADRKVGGRGKDQESDGGRNDVIQHRGGGDDRPGLRRRITVLHQFRLEGGGAEGGIGDRGAGGAGKQHAGQQRRLRQPRPPVADHGGGKTDQLVGDARLRQQAAGEQEKRDGKQQEFRHAGHGRGHDGRLRQGAAEGDRHIGRSEEGMGKRCRQHQPHRRRQRQKQAWRQARIDENFRQADIGHNGYGERRENGKHLAFTDALKRQIEKDQRATCTQKAETHPFRQAERGRSTAQHRRDLNPAESEDERRDEGEGIGENFSGGMKPLRQEAHEDIEPHGKRAFEAERRADRDHRHMQPDAEIFRADEAGVKQITQGDIDQHHHKKGRKDQRSHRAEHGVET
ncbi:hypothetical protein Ddc_23319 [Ditylenchus destructor]|nr:hypothetical protein Ddc_23319 [Ditylenchus destructor]